MSRHSAKSAGRSTKTVRAAAAKTARKTTKGVSKGVAKGVKTARAGSGIRAGAKKASKSARRPDVSKARAVPAAIARAPSVTPALAAGIIRTPSPPMQPVAPDRPLHAHKYQIGEAVFYTSPSFGRAAATGSYTVVKLLPSEGDDYQYRIKSSGEAFERVAKESQLDRV
jgi:hypothetical protein